MPVGMGMVPEHEVAEMVRAVKMYFGDLGLTLGLQKINKLINKICKIICKIFWGVLAVYIENSSASLIVIDKTSIELLTSKQGYNALQSEYEILNAICAVYSI